MHPILHRIIERKRLEVAEARQQCSFVQLLTEAELQAPCRPFAQRLQTRVAQGHTAVIAEIKKASPSKGVIRHDFQPAALAQSYAQHGATCLSVLTDHDFFHGDLHHLQEARTACELPVLRKDFIIDEYQIAESRAMQADCVLLIAAALDDVQLIAYEQFAHELGMDVLVEIHTRAELDRALQLNTPLIGINHRDLNTFDVSFEPSFTLAPHFPPTRLPIAESGICHRDDIARLREVDIQCFLIGETLMRQTDVGAALEDLMHTL